MKKIFFIETTTERQEECSEIRGFRKVHIEFVLDEIGAVWCIKEAFYDSLKDLSHFFVR